MIYLRIVRLRLRRSHQPLRGSATQDLSQKTWARSFAAAAIIVLELAQSDGDHCIGETIKDE